MRQMPLPGPCPIEIALEELSASGIETRGAIFTQREVVEFILDLAYYTIDQPLHKKRLLEPSFGGGAFLLIVVERLLEAWHHHTKEQASWEDLADCLRAVELHHDSFAATSQKVRKLLTSRGLSAPTARKLTERWLVQGDFLLSRLPHSFDYIVGNPPYVRQELIPDALIAAYRARYQTVFDRADIYIPFIEHSLSLLAPGGTLGFICADRWMKNRYGGPLRQLVANRFHLKVYVDMVNTPAFQTEVMAYPAITIIVNEKPSKTRIASRPKITKELLTVLARDLTARKTPGPDSQVMELADVASGQEPWILESFDQLALVRRLESEFPTIEETGCKVGIGLATGADKAFIGPYDELEVEPDRKLPLVMTRDILSGEVRWQGMGIINPFNDGGSLVDLRTYPKLRHHLEARKDIIASRHVARRAPVNWYRTIDRIYPTLTKTPKLLIPDIKGSAHIVYEDGQLYPHHNLYYIISDSWDLKALQGVLLSGIARLFVSVYSTRMRGGYLRFQAQYLRRIRLPRWQDVPVALRTELSIADGRGDIPGCNRAVFKLYKLSKEERAALGGNGE